MNYLFDDKARLEKAKNNFYKRFEVGNKGDCWEWQGFKNDSGYGILSAGVKCKQRAHRFMLSLIQGSPIPDDLEVLHKCDNPPCINPNHLRLGTHLENVLDCVNKKRNSKPPVKYGEKHHNTKFKAEDLMKIREDKRKYSDIAKDYGVCDETIGRVKRNQTWKNENIS